MEIIGVNHLFNFSITEDLDNNKLYLIEIDQPKLSLPDKEYYLNNKFQDIKDKYLEYMITCKTKLKLNINPTNILKFETELSKLCLTKSEQRNIKDTYNKVQIKDLTNFNLQDFLQVIALLSPYFKNYISTDFTLIVSNLKYFKEIDNLIKNTNIKIVKDYLIWQLINNSLVYMEDEMYKLSFSFYGKILHGIKEPKSREILNIDIISDLFDDLLGKIYGETYYSKEMNNKIINMITNIKQSMKNMLTNSWFEPTTKLVALKKLDTMNFKIGYPEEIIDYKKLQLSGNLLSQVGLIYTFSLHYNLKKLEISPSKNLWEMGAHIVNAYYDPQYNEIVLPAGILQPPFFDIDKSDSYNYGAIGTIIGHEISHGFDDQGRQYNENGDLKDWWSKTDDNIYINKVKLINEQYNNICLNNTNDTIIIDKSDHCINSNLTLGENIADICGVQISIDALKSIPNFNLNDFFISYSNLWKQKIKPATMNNLIQVDPHSPNILRVNNVLKNVNDFYKTYNIIPNDKMYIPPNKRINLWSKDENTNNNNLYSSLYKLTPTSII